MLHVNHPVESQSNTKEFLIAGKPSSDWLGNLCNVHCDGASSSPSILKRGVLNSDAGLEGSRGGVD